MTAKTKKPSETMMLPPPAGDEPVSLLDVIRKNPVTVKLTEKEALAEADRLAQHHENLRVANDQRNAELARVERAIHKHRAEAAGKLKQVAEEGSTASLDDLMGDHNRNVAELKTKQEHLSQLTEEGDKAVRAAQVDFHRHVVTHFETFIDALEPDIREAEEELRSLRDAYEKATVRWQEVVQQIDLLAAHHNRAKMKDALAGSRLPWEMPKGVLDRIPTIDRGPDRPVAAGEIFDRRLVTDDVRNAMRGRRYLGLYLRAIEEDPQAPHTEQERMEAVDKEPMSGPFSWQERAHRAAMRQLKQEEQTESEVAT